MERVLDETWCCYPKQGWSFGRLVRIVAPDRAEELRGGEWLPFRALKPSSSSISAASASSQSENTDSIPSVDGDSISRSQMRL